MHRREPRLTKIATHKTISREKEEKLHDYYNWIPYWQTLPMVVVEAETHRVPVVPVVPPHPSPEKQSAMQGIQLMMNQTG